MTMRTTYKNNYVCYMGRQISVAAAVILCLCGDTRPAVGQYIRFFPEEGGTPTVVTYRGDSAWLVSQEDERSQWHRFPTLVDVRLVDHHITLEELRYITNLKQVEALTIGMGPEAVTVENGSLTLLGSMPSLVELSLCIKGLSDDDLKVLRKIPNLEALHIGSDWDNQPILSDKAIGSIASIQKLTSVSIYPSGSFTDGAIRSLSELPHLVRLAIHSPHLTDSSLELLSRKTDIKELWVSSPQFTDRGVSALHRLTSLEDLNVESPNLSVRSLNIAGNMPHLRSLHLTVTDADEENVSLIAHLEKLQHVSFGNSPGSRRLQEAVVKLIESRSASAAEDSE